MCSARSTRCAKRSATTSTSRPDYRRLAHAARGRQAPRGLRQNSALDANDVAGQRLQRGRVARLGAARPRVERRVARGLRLRTEARWHVAGLALCRRQAGAGHHPRRWLGGRRRDPQRAYRAQCAAQHSCQDIGEGRPSARLRGTRRIADAAGRLSAHERRARTTRSAEVCQPTQCDGGNGASAGAEHHGAAAARFFLLRAVRQRTHDLRAPLGNFEGAANGRLQSQSQPPPRS